MADSKKGLFYKNTIFQELKKRFHNYQKQFRRGVSDGNGGYKVDVYFKPKLVSEYLSRLGYSSIQSRGRPMLRLVFSKRVYVTYLKIAKWVKLQKKNEKLMLYKIIFW